jgi:hypothetical protein
MHGLAASAFGIGVAVEVCVGAGVNVDVGGTGVLVEVGMGVSVGVLAGRGVPQADKIKARTIANLASEIFFMCRSLLATLIVARIDLKSRALTPDIHLSGRGSQPRYNSIFFIRLQIGVECQQTILISESKNINQ